MVLGVWLWAYGLALSVWLLGVWFWLYGFWAYVFGCMVLGVWVWAYGLALGIWFWAYDFGGMVMGVSAEINPTSKTWAPLPHASAVVFPSCPCPVCGRHSHY